MADPYLERETKFDVPGDFSFPGLPGARRGNHQLRATYYDTEDALLQRRGVTLRRRVGGPDDGWHVKLPDRGGRVELQAEVGPTRPPRELTALTRGLRFDQPLRRQAVLLTRRDTYRFHAPDGELTAEVSDDRVVAQVGPNADRVEWREVEIELGPAGTDETTAEVAELLRGAGATPSAYASKLDRAVGEPSQRPSLRGLGGLVDDYLQAQYERLAWVDLRMRRGDDVVHQARVAVRRTRSTLRTFAPVLDQDRAAHLDRELRWYAEALGGVRDLDVSRRYLEEDLRGDPDGLIVPEAAGELLDVLDHDREQARRHLASVLDGTRYGALLRELDGWRREPPMTAEAEQDAESVEDYVRLARTRSDKRFMRAQRSGEDSLDAASHRARRAAKRTRYAGELARPVLGRPAKRIVMDHKERQDALGALQDHAMVIEILRGVVARPRTSSGLVFVCGVLTQRHAAARAEARSHLR